MTGGQLRRLLPAIIKYARVQSMSEDLVTITPYITGCTDCLTCGKSVEQIQDEAVIDYLHKTAVRGKHQSNSMREDWHS